MMSAVESSVAYADAAALLSVSVSTMLGTDSDCNHRQGLGIVAVFRWPAP